MKIQYYFSLFLILHANQGICSKKTTLNILYKLPIELWHNIAASSPKSGVQTKISLLLAQYNKEMYYMFLQPYLERTAKNILQQNIFYKFHADEFTKNEFYSFLDQNNRKFLNEMYNNLRPEFFLHGSDIFIFSGFSYITDFKAWVKQRLSRIITKYNLPILIDILSINIDEKKYEKVLVQDKDKKYATILIPGLNLDENSWPIISFIENNYPQCVRIIVESIAKELCQNTKFILNNFKNKKITLQDKRGNTLLHLLYNYDCKELFFKCIEEGSNIQVARRNEETLVHEIIAKNQNETASINDLKYLLQKGIDINRKQSGNNTLVSFALFHKKYNIVKFFVTQGISVNTINDRGDTILHLFFIQIKKIQNEVVDITKFLLNCNIPVNVLNHERNSILNYIISYHSDDEENILKIVDLLINAGANINEQDNSGDTLLYLARRKGYKEISDFLIQEGAREDIKNDQGKFPEFYR